MYYNPSLKVVFCWRLTVLPITGGGEAARVIGYWLCAPPAGDLPPKGPPDVPSEVPP